MSFKEEDLLVFLSLSAVKEYTGRLDTEAEALCPSFKDVSTGEIKSVSPLDEVLCYEMVLFSFKSIDLQ